jgi:hypothetical protein
LGGSGSLKKRLPTIWMPPTMIATMLAAMSSDLTRFIRRRRSEGGASSSSKTSTSSTASTSGAAARGRRAVASFIAACAARRAAAMKLDLAPAAGSGLAPPSAASEAVMRPRRRGTRLDRFVGWQAGIDRPVIGRHHTARRRGGLGLRLRPLLPGRRRRGRWGRRYRHLQRRCRRHTRRRWRRMLDGAHRQLADRLGQVERLAVGDERRGCHWRRRAPVKAAGVI